MDLTRLSCAVWVEGEGKGRKRREPGAATRRPKGSQVLFDMLNRFVPGLKPDLVPTPEA